MLSGKKGVKKASRKKKEKENNLDISL